MKSLITAQKSRINGYKTSLSTYAVAYQSAKALNDAQAAGSLDYAAQITAQQTLITTKTGQLTTLQTSAASQQSVIATKQSALTALQSQKAAADATVSQTANVINNDTATVTTLTAQKTAGAADTTTFQSNVDSATAVLTSTFAMMEADADISQTILATCKANIMTKHDIGLFTSCMQTILPALN